MRGVFAPVLDVRKKRSNGKNSEHRMMKMILLVITRVRGRALQMNELLLMNWQFFPIHVRFTLSMRLEELRKNRSNIEF